MKEFKEYGGSRGDEPVRRTRTQRTAPNLRKPGESNAAKAPSERTVARLRKPGESNAAKAPSKFENFARVQMAAAFKGTFTAIIKHALQLLADAHGLGVLVRSMEWALESVKWLQVVEGNRQVDVGAPILFLGSGVELDLSAHPGYLSSNVQPPVTACFAPSGAPDPGVLVIDGCQISPGDAVDEDLAGGDRKAARHAVDREPEKAHVRPVDDEGRVVLIPLDLSQLTSRERDPRVRAEALMCLARAQLLPAFRQQRWDELEAEGVECVVYYDQEAKESVWLCLSETEKRPVRRRIAFDASGKLIPPGIWQAFSLDPPTDMSRRCY